MNFQISQFLQIPLILKAKYKKIEEVKINKYFGCYFNSNKNKTIMLFKGELAVKNIVKKIQRYLFRLAGFQFGGILLEENILAIRGAP